VAREDADQGVPGRRQARAERAQPGARGGRSDPFAEGDHPRLGAADEAADKLARELLGVLGQGVGGEADGTLDQAELGIVAQGVEVGQQAVDAGGGELGLEPREIEQERAQLGPVACFGEMVGQVAPEVGLVGRQRRPAA
jgi:hypothetical protein